MAGGSYVGAQASSVRNYAVFGLLVALCCGLYYASFSGGWLFDDHVAVVSIDHSRSK